MSGSVSLFASQSSLPPWKSVSSAPDFNSLGGGRSTGSKKVVLRLFPLVIGVNVTGVSGKLGGNAVFSISAADGEAMYVDE